MKYNINWIINGNIHVEASSKEEAELKIKKELEKIIEKNKLLFDNVGASAIQGSAKIVE